MTVALVVFNAVVVPIAHMNGRLYLWHLTLFFSVAWFVRGYLGAKRAVADFTIRITETELEGPGPPSENVIRLRDFDRTRSAVRSVSDRVLGEQYLYSTTGGQVLLRRWAFARSDLRKVLASLGM